MKRLVCLAVAGFAACWAVQAADVPAKDTPKVESYTQDIIYLAESRPVLIRLHVAVDGRPLSAVWDAYVNKVFKYLDASGNGTLDRTEVQRVPPPDVLFGTSFGVGSPGMTELDTNNDSKVTRDELAAYFRRIGAMPFQVPGGRGRGQADELYYSFAVLELDEVLLADSAVQVWGRQPANTDSVNDTLFKLIDANGDGKLSKDELVAAPTVLLKRDRNEDEVVTNDEIAPRAGRGNGTQFEVAQLYLSLSDYQGTRGNNGPFWLAHPGASRAELARRLQERYLKDGKKDQPAPTKLSRANLGLDETTFKKLDVDGDDALDTEELGRFAQRAPDLELKVNLGDKASVELVKRGAVMEANVRTGKDGVQMLELNGTRLDLKGLAVEKVDVAQAAQQERDAYLQTLKEADRDKNGYLDMSEAMRSPMYRNFFKLMDRDGDGMLFEKEVIAYHEAYQELQAAARLSCASVGITSEGKGLSELMDTDGDGRLSVREIRNAGKLIADLDRDNDSNIARSEIPRCSQATFRMGASGGGGSARTTALLLSGRVRTSLTPAARPPRGPEWFRKMDRNNDTDVSRREFLGTDAQFKEIDADSDGLISVEEAEKYDKKKRESEKK